MLLVLICSKNIAQLTCIYDSFFETKHNIGLIDTIELQCITEIILTVIILLIPNIVLK